MTLQASSLTKIFTPQVKFLYPTLILMMKSMKQACNQLSKKSCFPCVFHVLHKVYYVFVFAVYELPPVGIKSRVVLFIAQEQVQNGKLSVRKAEGKR